MLFRSVRLYGIAFPFPWDDRDFCVGFVYAERQFVRTQQLFKGLPERLVFAAFAGDLKFPIDLRVEFDRNLGQL